MASVPLSKLRRLSVTERIRLVEYLWDSVAAQPEQMETAPEQLAELECQRPVRSRVRGAPARGGRCVTTRNHRMLPVALLNVFARATNEEAREAAREVRVKAVTSSSPPRAIPRVAHPERTRPAWAKKGAS